MENQAESSREKRLQEVLVACVEAMEQGRNVDRQELLARHPEFAGELAEFFTGRDGIELVAAELRTLPPAAPRPSVGDAAPSTLSRAADAPAVPAPGTRIRYLGDYELLEEIGRGGMGVVYKARQVSLKRTVALKMILSGELANDADVGRFHAEAEAAAKLDHPGIVPVYEVGEHEGHHYFSMAFVEGESLARKIVQGLPSPREAAELTRKVAEAVAYAHVEGVIHRDLKPGNILIDKHGQPRLTDFGLAKRIHADAKISAGRELTASGQILGTPSYMPPEQASGQRGAVGPLSDVYSLGAVLYCLLTGRPPFQADNPLETLLQVLEQEPVSPRQLNVSVPRDLDTICLKCLAKEPRKRYASVRDFAADLDRFLSGQPIVARRIGPVGRLARWGRRNPALSSLLGVLILAGLSVVVLSLSLWQNAERRAQAVQDLEAAEEKLEEAKVSLIGLKLEAADKRMEIARRQAEALKLRLEATAKMKEVATLAEEVNDYHARSLLERARDALASGKPGRRWQALELIEQAEKLRGRDRQGLPPARRAGKEIVPTQHDLRQAAVAALLTNDARLLHEFHGQIGFPASIRADGAQALSLSIDLTQEKLGVRQFDLRSGKELAFFETFEMAWTTPPLSPDGKQAALMRPAKEGSWTPHLLELPSGKVIRTLPNPAGKPKTPELGTELIYSPDGRFLAGLKRDIARFQYLLWDLEKGEGRILVEEKSPGGAWLRFTADSSRFVLPTDEKTFTFWHTADSERSDKVELPLPILRNVVPALGPTIMAVACHGLSKEPVIIIWDLVQKREKSRLTGLMGPLTPLPTGSLALSRDENLLAASSGFGNLAVFDLRLGAKSLELPGAHRNAISGVAWQGDRYLVSNSIDGAIKVWELSNPLVQPIVAEKKPVQFGISPDGRWLALSGSDPKDKLRLLPRRKGDNEREFPGHGAFAFRGDSQQLAIAGPGGAAVWDLKAGAEVARLKTDETLYSRMAFDAQGDLLVVRRTKDRPGVWNVTKGKEVWSYPGQDAATVIPTLSPDGQHLVALPTLRDFKKGEMTMTFWELASGRPSKAIPLRPGAGISAFFSSDSKWLAVPYLVIRLTGNFNPVQPANETRLAVYSFPSGEQHLDLGTEAPVNALAFSVAGQWIAFGGLDGVVHLWDLKRKEEICRWKTAGRVNQIAWSPAGDQLLSGDGQSVQALDVQQLRRQLQAIKLDW